MARRRLSPLPQAPEVKTLTRLSAAPPIAAEAASSSREAALAEMSAELEAARAEGRMVLDLSLDAIEVDHLARDRILAQDEAFEALKTSIAEHGQRTPIDVAHLGEGRYGLISGWRRLEALRALQAPTVRALARPPAEASQAYIAMVEENEVRLGLSYYERARIALQAVERGVYPSEKVALLALYATASRAKRSRIRSFVEVVRALDGVLAFPTALGERLGLKLAEALQGPGQKAIVAGLRKATFETAEAEQAEIARLIAAPPKAPAPAKPGPYDFQLPNLSLSQARKGKRLTVTLEGAEVDETLQRALHDLVEAWAKRND